MLAKTVGKLSKKFNNLKDFLKDCLMLQLKEKIEKLNKLNIDLEKLFMISIDSFFLCGKSGIIQ